jgi:uncharacterized protein (DUF1697 family)
MTDRPAARTYVALLRAVNVGGTKRMAMAQLRASLEALGLADVRTYLQSGNAVFRAPDTGEGAEQALAERISECIATDFGHAVEVLVLTAEQLAAIVADNPFAARPDADIKTLGATFLFSAIDEATFAALTLAVAPGEEAAWGGSVVYLHLPHGYANTKLDPGRALKMPATTRNWRTVLALNEMADEEGSNHR